MNPNDPLSELLKAWRPRSPRGDGNVIHGTLRALREARVQPSWKSVLSEWLPKPSVLFPIAASLMLLAAGIQWTRLNDDARQIVLQKWQSELVRPLGKTSLASTYAQLETKTTP